MGLPGIGGGGILGSLVGAFGGFDSSTGSSSSGQHFVGSALPIATYGGDIADGAINAGHYVGDGAVTSLSGGGISGSNVASDVGHITGVTGNTTLTTSCHSATSPDCDGNKTYTLSGADVTTVLMARQHHETEPLGHSVTNLTNLKKR